MYEPDTKVKDSQGVVFEIVSVTEREKKQNIYEIKKVNSSDSSVTILEDEFNSYTLCE